MTITREQLIQDLQAAGIRAVPTTFTMDMGLQYDYITPEGAGTGFGDMGTWPLHRLKQPNSERYRAIREALEHEELTMELVEGTSLEQFARYCGSYDNELPDVQELLEGLLELPDRLYGDLYCLYDAAAGWEHPEFYANESFLMQAFELGYCSFMSCYWKAADQETLESWHSRLSDDLGETQMNTFGFGGEDVE